MTRLSFAPWFERPSYALPALESLNVYAEATPIGVTYLPRPRLALQFERGSGPVRGIQRSFGAIEGSFFVASGSEVYRGATMIGNIGGGRLPVRFASSSTMMVMVDRSGTAWTNTGVGNLLAVDDPDLPQVDDVAILQDRAFYKELDSDQVWFSALDDLRSIDGLAFEAVDDKPGNIVRMMPINGQMAFLCQQTVEFWEATGSADAPLAANTSAIFDKGCAAGDSVVVADNAILFVGTDHKVYRTAGGVPADISTPKISERLRLSSDVSSCTAYTFTLDNHEFYVLNIPGQGTVAYDLSTSTTGSLVSGPSHSWYPWGSYGLDRFRISCASTLGGTIWLGDYETGQVSIFSPGSLRDYATWNVEYIVSAYAPLEAGVQRCDVVALQCVRGVGTGGSNYDPQVEMSYSDDAGRTYSDWRPQSLGPRGEYRDKAVWRRLGRMVSPGRIFRFRSLNPLGFVAESMTLQDQRP